MVRAADLSRGAHPAKRDSSARWKLTARSRRTVPLGGMRSQARALSLKHFVIHLRAGPAAQSGDRSLGLCTRGWEKGILPREPLLELQQDLRRRIDGWLR